MTHFIGLDEQTLLVVQLHQYEIPICNYSTNVMVPQVFDEVNKHFCNVVNEASVTNLTTDIQILPETFVWKYRYLYSYRQLLRSKYRYRIGLRKKKCYRTVHPY